VAAVFLLQLAVAVVGIPAEANWWFAGPRLEPGEIPQTVVVLGGGGIPSESGLVRTYHAAAIGTNFPAARFIVSLPADEDPETSSVGRMRDELVMRGIRRASILMEHDALNTRQQAVAIREMLGTDALDQPILLVTSPTHGRRAVLCFRKAGFRKAGCSVAQVVAAEADPGEFAAVRYGFWRGMEIQVRFARELTAMVCYKLRGWI